MLKLAGMLWVLATLSLGFNDSLGVSLLISNPLRLR